MAADGYTLTPYPVEWARDDWLAWRSEGVGGSDVAAVCGLSPWGSPLTVWLDKTGRAAPVPESEPMRWGNILEPVVADAFEDETGLYVHHRQTLAVDLEHPHRRVTLDGLAADHPPTPGSTTGLWLGVVQVKTTRSGAWDELPDQYALQVQWEMGITRQERAYVPTLHHGNTFRIYEVAADPAAFAAMADLVGRFWHDHVLADVAPPADGDPSTTRALRDAFTDVEAGRAVDLEADVVDLLRELPAAKAAVKTAEARRDHIENALRLALGDAEAGLVDGAPVVTWKAQTVRGRLDARTLEADHPTLAAQYRGPDTTTRVLRTTKALADLA